MTVMENCFHRCANGWLPEHPDTGQPRPCPTCRPRAYREAVRLAHEKLRELRAREDRR